jgi:2-polyprenyl-3-methyl-5-hydroxy-6-metoxy-1,4-benzoquinol methylase
MSKYSKIAPKAQTKLIAHLGGLYDYIHEGDRVLDFGSSTGYFGKLLIDTKNCVVDGIEIDPSDYKAAAKVLNLMYSFDLDSGKWPPQLYKNKYDVLFFGDILEHLKYPERTLKNAKPLLKKGGRVLISTPNVAHLSTRLELLAGEFNYEETGLLDSTHLKYFTLRSLQKMAADSGYKITNVDYSLVDFDPTVVKRLLNKLGLKPADDFWKLVNSPEARAYQYKLVLEPLAAGEKTFVPKIPAKPIAEHEVLGQQILRLRQERNELESQVIRLSTELNNILSSKTWRTASLVKKPYLYVRSKSKK